MFPWTYELLLYDTIETLDRQSTTLSPDTDSGASRRRIPRDIWVSIARSYLYPSILF